MIDEAIAKENLFHHLQISKMSKSKKKEYANQKCKSWVNLNLNDSKWG